MDVMHINDNLGNAVMRMIETGVEGVQFAAINTGNNCYCNSTDIDDTDEDGINDKQYHHHLHYHH